MKISAGFFEMTNGRIAKNQIRKILLKESCCNKGTPVEGTR
jgi:hypothetical protein